MREKIGAVGVDTGCIWIGDPGHIHGDSKDDHPLKNWRRFCDLLEKREKDGISVFGFGKDFEGAVLLGINVSNFGGDGIYPVYVERDEEGFIERVEIAFEGQAS